ncbi:MAG: carboxylating nicotinate-nucleotide diphosphorylase [Nitrospinae bacterium]|nr:carboxylating nicotinate-nucleotide diphosphorylase [Nitrospinota bacterium]
MDAKTLLTKVRPHIIAALKEDCPAGDITTAASVDKRQKSNAFVVAKQAMTLAGIPVFKEVMRTVDSSITVTLLAKDGQTVPKGKKIMEIQGPSAAILKAERVALNYLQRMCGIATLTAAHVRHTRGTKAKILDTRKTTPTLRLLEKYAVTCGGGHNHRFGLSDAPLIKENHIRAAGGIANAVRRVKKACKKPLVLEVTNRAEVLEGLEAGAEILLLDNMTPAQVKTTVKLIGGKALVEVSGGVNLKTVGAFARAGADRISVGALTHSAPSADLSLLFEK